MKIKIILLASTFVPLLLQAQTNAIVFPQLLSPTNSVLMTNAEFRSVAGYRIIFKNNAGYAVFHASDLNSNVLTALHLNAGQLESRQKSADAADAAYRAEQARAQLIMEREESARIAALNKAAANASKHVIANTQPASSWRTINEDQANGSYAP